MGKGERGWESGVGGEGLGERGGGREEGKLLRGEVHTYTADRQTRLHQFGNYVSVEI